ncbi:MAG TPA: ATP-grasp domain-containing protein [Gemmatimonadaceae bacterium]|jgi:predicted ATP-grasp superfamily ATP-dependent carboligase|nr:ATP-grasp domain-containing protein [Gemmatimonadaceae bacterium]
MHSRRILVTDGEQRSALALVRSLGRAGHSVFVCSASGRSLAGASRYSREEARVADPLRGGEGFAADVLELVDRWKIDVLIPVSEGALLALLPARARMGDVALPFPDEATFRRICDKAELLSVAPRVGIAIPEQVRVETVSDARSLDPAAIRYPVVLKPSRSVGEGGATGARGGRGGSVGEPAGARTKLTVRHAANATELEIALAELAEAGDAAFPLLIQQRIVGPGIGIFLLLWEGRTLATFAHRRIREKPPSGGVSVYRESVAADPALVTRSRALLEHFGWCGVAMVEYKVDERTGTPYLMEVNGRFWGSLQLAVDAGVDFPVLLVSAATGEPTEPVNTYTAGVRSRWWWGDVDHLIARLRRSRAELSLPPEAPGRWRALRDFFTIHFGRDREEILRLDDPRPFFRESVQWFHL